MGYRYLLWRDKLLLITLVLFFYSYSSPIRVVVRSLLEGREFKWAYYAGVTPDGKAAVAHGEGLYGHFDYVLLNAFAIVWLLCMGLRQPDSFFRCALVAFTSIGLASAIWLELGIEGNLQVGKETLGLEGLSFLWSELFPTFLAWSSASALLIWGICRETILPRPAWTPLNKWLLAAAAVILGLAALLLNFGEQHGWVDFNGIGMIYLALILFLIGMSPWERGAPGGEEPIRA